MTGVTGDAAVSSPTSTVSSTDRFSEKLCVWACPAFMTLFGIGIVLGGFLPPPGAWMSPDQIAAFYANGFETHRLGLVILTTGGLFLLPFGVATAREVRRIEGPGSPMAYLVVGAATFTVTPMLIYFFFLLTITLRPDRSPELIQLVNDMVWLPFVGMYQPGALWALGVGVAVLRDRRPAADRTFPRWFGWMGIWYVFTSFLEILVPFFISGPFAWHGLISFYLGASAIFIWWITAFVLMARGLRTTTDVGHAS